MKREIYFAGGCFWGVEEYFRQVKGVLETEVGYANGDLHNPTYEAVCRGNTGHAEAVKIVYEDTKISLRFLLGLFYEIIDPTSVDRQGNDRGRQYRTGIYYTQEDDRCLIEASLANLQEQYRRPLAVEVQPLQNYAKAEEYHQRYLEHNPDGYCHIGRQAFERAAQAEDKKARFQKKSAEDLKKMITPLQYEVAVHNGTEPPHRNEYYDLFEPGIYVDITTGEPLFASADKFDAGCGWPSFSRPIQTDVVHEKEDTSFGMRRTEVRSKTGDIHLGHVFEDGPSSGGGLRYCINSAALRFIPRNQMQQEGYGAYLPLVEE